MKPETRAELDRIEHQSFARDRRLSNDSNDLIREIKRTNEAVQRLTRRVEALETPQEPAQPNRWSGLSNRELSEYVRYPRPYMNDKCRHEIADELLRRLEK